MLPFCFLSHFPGQLLDVFATYVPDSCEVSVLWEHMPTCLYLRDTGDRAKSDFGQAAITSSAGTPRETEHVSKVYMSKLDQPNHQIIGHYRIVSPYFLFHCFIANSQFRWLVRFVVAFTARPSKRVFDSH